jgi:hypothetical protein
MDKHKENKHPRTSERDIRREIHSLSSANLKVRNWQQSQSRSSSSAAENSVPVRDVNDPQQSAQNAHQQQQSFQQSQYELYMQQMQMYVQTIETQNALLKEQNEKLSSNRSSYEDYMDKRQIIKTIIDLTEDEDKPKTCRPEPRTSFRVDGLEGDDYVVQFSVKKSKTAAQKISEKNEDKISALSDQISLRAIEGGSEINSDNNNNNNPSSSADKSPKVTSTTLSVNAEVPAVVASKQTAPSVYAVKQSAPTTIPPPPQISEAFKRPIKAAEAEETKKQRLENKPSTSLPNGNKLVGSGSSNIKVKAINSSGQKAKWDPKWGESWDDD